MTKETKKKPNRCQLIAKMYLFFFSIIVFLLIHGVFMCANVMCYAHQIKFQFTSPINNAWVRYSLI